MQGKGWYLTVWGIAYLGYGFFHPEYPWGALFIVSGVTASASLLFRRFNSYYHSVERVAFVAIAAVAFARLIYVLIHGSLVLGASYSALFIWGGMCFSHLVVAGLRDVS